jgi:hypothetical protein
VPFLFGWGNGAEMQTMSIVSRSKFGDKVFLQFRGIVHQSWMFHNNSFKTWMQGFFTSSSTLEGQVKNI